ncbi:hypothetical protein HSR121_1363 [Halapricum desulfuricans]|uniref:Uncharacterized protein n=1 Tax=Halapricum desulfuricans TaxID=2841257 RepID=A0A897MZ19_9EURY|nr:hypothetical protein HSR121_1363 [Halapricum desulfuricans]
MVVRLVVGKKPEIRRLCCHTTVFIARRQKRSPAGVKVDIERVRSCPTPG